MYRFTKRVLDLAIAMIALILLVPLLAGIALGVVISLGRPVFFVQERIGRGGRVFSLVKFRTMAPARAPDATDEQRLTWFGRRLRAASLDELPELLHVVRGEMSLVGPRPLLTEYLDRYTPRQARRHEVRPGLTGWAQVHGRNEVDWEERFELDVWYVEHRGMLLDLRILWRTLGLVLRGDGIGARGQATMPRFTGSNPPSGGA